MTTKKKKSGARDMPVMPAKPYRMPGSKLSC